MSKQTNIEMLVRDYNAVEYYLRDRLTEKEIELVNSFVDLENMEDVDELYTALNQDTLVDMMTWELKEVSTDDFIEEFSTFRKLNRIVKKLWNNNHEVIKKLKDILNEEEFKYVTEFCVIYTGDNDIVRGDDCNFGEYYETLEKFEEMIKDLFIDQLAELDEEIKTEYYQHWATTISSAIRKITMFNYDEQRLRNKSTIITEEK